jgi:hypothetical protein
VNIRYVETNVNIRYVETNVNIRYVETNVNIRYVETNVNLGGKQCVYSGCVSCVSFVSCVSCVSCASCVVCASCVHRVHRVYHRVLWYLAYRGVYPVSSIQEAGRSMHIYKCHVPRNNQSTISSVPPPPLWFKTALCSLVCTSHSLGDPFYIFKNSHVERYSRRSV